MNKYICLIAAVALMSACEKKEETTVNPPGETKTENNTTVVKEATPAEATKTETNTTINNAAPSPAGESTTTTTTTSSPNP